jgi:hypothetical protein
MSHPDPLRDYEEDMNKYTITIGFNTDRPLTEDELNAIAAQCAAQVEEPVDGNGDDMDVTVSDTSIRLD